MIYSVGVASGMVFTAEEEKQGLFGPGSCYLDIVCVVGKYFPVNHFSPVVINETEKSQAA